LRDAAGDKPFLAVKVCVNNGAFETPAYRVALAMGQIYYKLLTRLNACRVMYCWTWFNRLKGGPARCLCPTRSMASTNSIQSSVTHLWRVLPAGTRRHVARESSKRDILAVAFQDAAGKQSLILLNRTVREQKVAIIWPGAAFAYVERLTRTTRML
jgi:hypothetical protein